jgi:preprotein translocase subunit SecA
VESVVEFHTQSPVPEEWEIDEMMVGLRSIYPAALDLDTLGPREEIDRDDLIDLAVADATTRYEHKEKVLTAIDPELMRRAERFYLLQTIDTRWREHLDNMDYLRDGIHLRGLAQKDPVVEYRTEGHQMFTEMMNEVREEVVKGLFQFVIQVDGPDGRSTLDPFQLDEELDGLVLEHDEANAFTGESEPQQVPAAAAATPQRADTEWARSSSWTGTSRPDEGDEVRSSSTPLRGQAPGAAGRKKKSAPKRKRKRG